MHTLRGKMFQLSQSTQTADILVYCFVGTVGGGWGDPVSSRRSIMFVGVCLYRTNGNPQMGLYCWLCCVCVALCVCLLSDCLCCLLCLH